MENKWSRWYEADCIRKKVDTMRMSPVFEGPAKKWSEDWTLFGKIHIHKCATGYSEKLPLECTWYKESWDTYLHTDPDCVEIKRLCDLYEIGTKN
jgi:hypothetical protein